ncbi:MAG: Uma2 family endonuclease [Bacteroidota bacterium]
MPTSLAQPARQARSRLSEADLRAFAQRGVQFTVEAFHQLAASGVLGEEDRVELLDGHLVTMAPVGPSHLFATNRLERLFGQRLYAERPFPAHVSVQNPIRLDDGTEPIPDLVLLRPDTREDRVPRPEDVLLVVEVAESSADFDREVKRPRYAAAGIPEVWLVLPGERVVEVARRPSAAALADSVFAEVIRHGEEAQLNVAALPDLAPLPVADMFVPRADTNDDGR